MNRQPAPSPTGPSRLGRFALPVPGWVRDTQQAYKRVPLRYLAAGWVTLTVLTAAATSSINGPVTIATAVAATTAVVVHALLRHPGLVATTIVLAIGVLLAVPVSSLYALSATSGNFVDLPTATLTLTLTYLLAALIAHRSSRGRLWLTMALVVGVVCMVGPFLTLIYPPFGFGWAWAATGVVLWLRGGGTPWLVEQRHRFTSSYKDNADTQERTQARVSATTATATLLAGLPEGYKVLSDRRDPAFGGHVDHLIIGPTGLTVLTSHRFKGRLTDDPVRGLTHPTVDVGQLLNDTDTLTAAVGTRMRLPKVPVRAMSVFHDTVLTAPVTRIGLEAENGDPLGAVTLLSPTALIAQITGADETLNARQVAHAHARLDRLCRPAGPRDPDEHVACASTFMVVMNAEGTRTPHEAPRVPTPMFHTSTTIFDTHVGQPVSVLTDQGVYDGYEVTDNPITDDSGLTLVPLRDTTAALTPEGETVTVWMPFDSIQPLDRAN